MVEHERALITGINGFTGGYVAAELEQSGYKVFGVDAHAHPSPGVSIVDQNYYQVDLADVKQLATVIAEINPHVVVHLAAVAFVGHGDASAFYQVNLIGTRNLLVALELSAPLIESILLVSSANIYGNTSEGILREDALPQPANDYAVSKLAMEQMAGLWRNRLPLILVRPFNYTGVGQSPNFLIPKIISHFARREKKIELGNLDVWREFNDVRFISAIYRRLLVAKPLGQTLNVCTGRMYSLREVLSLAEKFSGHSLEVRVNEKFVRPNEVIRLCGDNEKLVRVIGEYTSYSLEETLTWMLRALH